ncbi:MAG: cell division protein FtsA, partial [Leptospira sp.]|nr:cell division protein FtsA [Leptospira sp.]
VDDQTSIKDPIGMTGVKLETEVHIVTAGTTAIHNLDRCIESAGLTQVDRVLSSLASSEAILTGQDKDLGVAVLDIGAGVCDLIIYIEGGVAFSSIVPLGGYHITSDVSIGLKTPIDSAEIIKKRFGQTIVEHVDPTEKIEIPAASGRPSRSVLRQELVRIIEPRTREILELVEAELQRSGVKSSIVGGVILTGGVSMLPGIELLAEEIFGLSVGKARPAGLSGIAEKIATPEYSTSVGLIKYAARLVNIEQTTQETWGEKEGWTKKVRRWMENNL